MKIIYKFYLIFAIVTLLIVAGGYLSVKTSEKILEKSIEENSFWFASEILDKVDRTIHSRIEIFREYSKAFTLQKPVIISNREFEKLGNIQEYIDKKEREWISVPKETITPFMETLLSNRSAEEIREKLKYYEEKYGYGFFAEIIVTNKYGANVAMSGKTSDYRQDDEKWWQATKRDGVYVKDIDYDESSDVYSINIGISVMDEDENFIGTIKIIYNVEEVISELKRLSKSPSFAKYKSLKYLIATREGKIIFSTGPHKFFEDVTHLLPPGQFNDSQSLAEKRFSPTGDVFIIHTHSKGYKDFKGLGWTSIVEYGAEEIFAPVIQLKKAVLMITLVITFFTVAIGIIVSRTISRPIIKLRNASKEVGRGKLDIHVDIESNDEIGQLAASFNQMSKDLLQSGNEIISAKNYTENIITSMLDTLVVVTPEATIRTVNQALCNLLGYREEELAGQPVARIITGEEVLFHGKMLDDLKQKGFIGNLEKTYLSKEGREIPVLFSASVMRNREDKIQGIVCVALDVTERKWMEEQLRKESFYNSAIAGLSETLLTKGDNIKTIANIVLKHALELTGSKYGFVSEVDPEADNIVGHTLTEIMDEECKVAGKSKHITFAKGPKGYAGLWGHSLNTLKGFYTNKPDEHKSFAGSAPAGHFSLERFLTVPSIVAGKLIGQIALANAEKDYTSQDIRNVKRLADLYAIAVERKRGEEKLKAAYMDLDETQKAGLNIMGDLDRERKALDVSLKEKEVLLLEIHHRVKNNMQVISSLLTLQAGYVKEKKYVEMFKESERRIKSMALVHEKLYRTEDLANIYFADYIKTLVNGIFQSFGAKAGKVALNIEAEDIVLGIDAAIPCGLLLNELITNSLKHGFPEDRKGEINIEMRNVECGLGNGDLKTKPEKQDSKLKIIELIVRDDGIGMPKDLDYQTSRSLGLSLVTTLVGQLHGEIKLKRENGTEWWIRFEEKKQRH